MSHNSVFEEYQVDLKQKRKTSVTTYGYIIFPENIMFHKC